MADSHPCPNCGAPLRRDDEASTDRDARWRCDACSVRNWSIEQVANDPVLDAARQRIDEYCLAKQLVVDYSYPTEGSLLLGFRALPDDATQLKLRDLAAPIELRFVHDPNFVWTHDE